MLRCTGCGSTKTIEEIRAKHPKAIACCPERDMREEPAWTEEDMERINAKAGRLWQNLNPD